MNKVVSNIKYKLGYQYTWALWHLAIYVPLIFVIFFILIKTSVISSHEGSLVYRLWSAVIFLFAISTKFKEDFDYLLTMSSTRKNIFLALLGVILIFSTFFSSLIVVEKVIVDHLNNILGFHNISDPFHFVAPYASGNLFLLFVFSLALTVCASVFGFLTGSLFYRYGRKFTVGFWLVISSIPFVLFPLFLWALYQRGHLTVSIDAMGTFFRDFNVLAGTGYLLLGAIIFGAAAYLNIRRLPQK